MKKPAPFGRGWIGQRTYPGRKIWDIGQEYIEISAKHIGDWHMKTIDTDGGIRDETRRFKGIYVTSQ